ncbi:MAG TPA: hypothetical protein VN709_07350 [Terriglobales bacterium]|nr:hypothetical protein [Terriglobales bacterium]
MNKLLAAPALIAVLALFASAQLPEPDQHPLQSFTYRNIGPFWTGGMRKTTNGETTFQPVFDSQNNLNIGAIAVAPSNDNIVWAGTGDARTSRSSLAGNGV